MSGRSPPRAAAAGPGEHHGARATDVSGDRAIVRAVLLNTFDRIPTTFAKRSWNTADRTRDGWRVRSDRALGVHAPWEVGRYTTRRTAHFLTLAPRRLTSPVSRRTSSAAAPTCCMRCPASGYRASCSSWSPAVTPTRAP
jgi:hypothetical protein